MKTISNLTSLGLGGAAVFTALLTTLPAAAGEVTACIGPGGAITAAAAGSQPLRKCPPNHVQETFGSATSGEPGEDGTDGISCWDLNQDGVKDEDEDFNKDGTVDVLDCRPAEVYTGEPTERTWYVSSNALLTASGDPKDEHYLGIYDYQIEGCFSGFDPGNPDCLIDPIADQCGLWDWKKSGDDSATQLWSVQAKQGYNYATYNYLAWDGSQYFGWQDCRDACLADKQCVGASIEEAEGTENGMVCKLVAKTQAPGNTPFRNDAINNKEGTAAIWQGRDFNILIATRGAVLSVCPAP